MQERTRQDALGADKEVQRLSEKNVRVAEGSITGRDPTTPREMRFAHFLLRSG